MACSGADGAKRRVTEEQERAESWALMRQDASARVERQLAVMRAPRWELEADDGEVVRPPHRRSEPPRPKATKPAAAPKPDAARQAPIDEAEEARWLAAQEASWQAFLAHDAAAKRATPACAS